MWDVDSQCFMVGDQTLEIEVDEIYFLIGLSRRGESVYFGGRGGSGESVDSYVSDLCAQGTSTHLASKSQVLISLRATDGVVFDWCSSLLANLKDQLTCFHLGQ